MLYVLRRAHARTRQDKKVILLPSGRHIRRVRTHWPAHGVTRAFSTRFFSLPARTKSYFLLLYVRSTILVSHIMIFLTKDHKFQIPILSRGVAVGTHTDTPVFRARSKSTDFLSKLRKLEARGTRARSGCSHLALARDAARFGTAARLHRQPTCRDAGCGVGGELTERGHEKNYREGGVA